MRRLVLGLGSVAVVAAWGGCGVECDERTEQAAVAAEVDALACDWMGTVEHPACLIPFGDSDQPEEAYTDVFCALATDECKSGDEAIALACEVEYIEPGETGGTGA